MTQLRAHILITRHPERAKHISSAMEMGIRRCGDQVTMTGPTESMPGDVLVAYGWVNRTAFEAYRAAGRNYAYIDLGYWNRRPAHNKYDGHHKVILNARHPNAYFQNTPRPADRWKRLGVPVKPWRQDGRHIVLFGMSPKSADSYGSPDQTIDRDLLARIKAATSRPVIYRPKPTRHTFEPLSGAMYNDPRTPMSEVLDNAWASVTNHSNAAIDSLVAGVPVFCLDGAAHRLSMKSLSEIDSPPLPDGREQLLHDLAYCQWSGAEMRSGACWDYIKQELLR